MDPFEVRMQFIALLQKLAASQQSIQRVVNYAIKHYSSCGEDIWDCILEDCEKGSVNARINILYFLDNLCERCLIINSQQKAQPHPHRSSASAKRTTTLYVDFVTRDLLKIIGHVVPEGRQGLPNLISTRQILENWRTKRVIDPQRVEEALLVLHERSQSQPAVTSPSELQETSKKNGSASSTLSSPPHMSKNDVITRIEEDRERHKRLRERRWVQPISYAASTSNPNHMPLASFLPLVSGKGSPGLGAGADDELPLDIEFENDWETTSDWNEDDEEIISEEREMCFPREGEEPMDLS